MTNKLSRWDSNMIVAVSAVLIGVCALFVSIVQTNLQRKQSYAAAWPYLEIDTDMLDNQFYFRVTNKGVGPAIVKQTQLTYKEKKYDSIVKLAKEIAGKQDTFMPHYWDRLDKRVIAPQEEIDYLLLTDSADAERFRLELPNVKLRIAYASVYDQLWVAFENQNVIEIKHLKEFDKRTK
jgi:hypothetical protein